MGTLYIDTGGASTNSGSNDGALLLNGTTNAVVNGDKNFADADVNTGTDQVTIATHGYVSGTGVLLSNAGGTLPAGLATNIFYYLYVVDANTIAFCKTVADAEAGTNLVDITAAAGAGVHTVNDYTVKITSGTPDLLTTGVNCYHARCTTTGTNNIFTMAGGLHGLTTEDVVTFSATTPPGGTGSGSRYYVRALSTTTFRIYSTAGLATADTTDNNTGVNVTSAETTTLTLITSVQASIALASASNTNRKMFWIRAVSNTNDLVIVDAKVTGLGAGSSWVIGGRLLWTSGIVDAALRGSDVVLFNNTPATNPSASAVIVRSSGNSSLGDIVYRGKSATFPVIQTSNSGSYALDAASTAVDRVRYEGLRFEASTGTQDCVGISNTARFHTMYNCKVMNGGGYGIRAGGIGPHTFIGCEVSGVDSYGLYLDTPGFVAIGNYIHDCLNDGISASTGIANTTILNNIIKSNSGRGIYINGSSLSSSSIVTITIAGNTVYGNGNSGFECNDIDPHFVLINNIFSMNGNAAGEGNIEMTAAGSLSAACFHAWNVFYHDGTGGASNIVLTNSSPALLVNGMVASSEFITDPAFVNAASANFSLRGISSARAAGFPGAFLGGSTGYMDIGAVQSKLPVMINPGLSGGLR